LLTDQIEENKCSDAGDRGSDDRGGAPLCQTAIFIRWILVLIAELAERRERRTGAWSAQR
jgi:hypothetical protein